MKPLNTAERRKAFWKFTLLFILAVMPVCIAIYLYGRVDNVENNFLRTNYVKEGKKQDGKLDRNTYYTDIKFAIANLNTYLIENEPNFINYQLYGNIMTSIDKIQAKQDRFYVDVVKTNGTALDSLTWDIVRLEIDNLKRLQNIYEKTSAKMNDQFEKLEIAKEDLKECQGKLN